MEDEQGAHQNPTHIMRHVSVSVTFKRADAKRRHPETGFKARRICDIFLDLISLGAFF